MRGDTELAPARPRAARRKPALQLQVAVGQAVQPPATEPLVEMGEIAHPSPGDADANQSQRMLESAMSECQNLAVLSIVTGSVLNDLHARFRGFIPSHATQYMPATPVVLPHLFSENRGQACSFASVAIAAAISDDLAQAKALLRSSCSTRNARRPINSDTMEAVAHAWRAVAGRVLLAIFELERISEHFGAVTEADALQRLTRLLMQVRDGGAPCVQNGQAVFPEGVQRRRSRRICLNSCGIVRCRAGALPILATDISTSGIGLDHAKCVSVGEIVSITIGKRRFVMSDELERYIQSRIEVAEGGGYIPMPPPHLRVKG